MTLILAFVEALFMDSFIELTDVKLFFFLFFFLIFIFTLFYFTILYRFCHTLTWIHHGCTCIPKHEPPSHLPPHNISLGHIHAPAPSMLYPASDIDWWFDSYMIANKLILFLFLQYSLVKSLSVKVKEESEKTGLKLNIQKGNITACSPITSWQIDGEAIETVTDYFMGLQNHCRWWLQPWN